MKSNQALIFCYIVMIFAGFFFFPKWNHGGTEATISWDVSGYYNYLPAIFIYHDIKECRYQESIGEKYNPTSYFEAAASYKDWNGKVMQYTCGQAIVMAPWFFASHFCAKFLSSYPADGFSMPYQMGLGVGMFIYSLIGLFLLRKILLQNFEDKIVAHTLLIITLGTCYLNYAAIDQAQVNPTLFTLYCLLIIMTSIFYQNPSLKLGIFISLLVGLITLIRPTDLICVSIPLFWGVSNWSQFRKRVLIWKTQIKRLPIYLFCFLFIVSLQFIYWKYVTDSWYVYTYRDQGFTWLNPHIYDFLFSTHSGYLRYSPMMIFSLLGLGILYSKAIHRVSIFIILILSFIITTAWDLWDYGWYSGRAMIQYFPLYAFSVASLIEYLERKRWIKYGFYSLVILFIYFNIWWTYHIHAGKIGAMGLTDEQYWQNILRF